MTQNPTQPDNQRAIREVRIINQLGLHARPAAEFVRHANSFRSEIWLSTPKGRFSALSLIDVMRANLDYNSVATLEAIGPDAERAAEKLAMIISQLSDSP